MKYLLLILISFLAFRYAGAQTFDPDYLDGELYIKVEDSSNIVLAPLPNIPALTQILNQFAFDTIYKAFTAQDPVIERIYRMEFADVNGTNLLISQLEALSFIEYAEQVPLIQTTGTSYFPNDLQPQQWGLTKVNAVQAWDISKGSPNIKVAIVDNAVSTTHEDLDSIIWTNPGEIPNNFLDDDFNGYTDDVNGYDVANYDPNPNPPASASFNSPWVHGTHCAGIAGAASDNAIGIASIGFGISIIPVKASMDATGGNTLERAYEGVDYAVAAGADIVSMSWGSSGNSATGSLVMSMARSRGIVLIAAAGNNNTSNVFYPAGYPDVIAIGSTDQTDLKSGFSNYGAWVDMMAPGSSIYSSLSDSSNSAYGSLSGTSMACPLVSGLAGLILSAVPNLPPQQVKTALENGCENIDLINPQYIGQMGSGRINAYNSLLSLGLTEIKDQVQDEVSSYRLYPNPVKDRLYIQTLDSVLEITIFNIQGQLLGTWKVNGLIDSIDLSQFESGAYLVKISEGDISKMQWIMKLLI